MRLLERLNDGDQVRFADNSFTRDLYYPGIYNGDGTIIHENNTHSFIIDPKELKKLTSRQTDFNIFDIPKQIVNNVSEFLDPEGYHNSLVEDMGIKPGDHIRILMTQRAINFWGTDFYFPQIYHDGIYIGEGKSQVIHFYKKDLSHEEKWEMLKSGNKANFTKITKTNIQRFIGEAYRKFSTTEEKIKKLELFKYRKGTIIDRGKSIERANKLWECTCEYDLNKKMDIKIFENNCDLYDLDYELFTMNCEHLARYCVTGEKYSEQIRKIPTCLQTLGIALCTHKDFRTLLDTSFVNIDYLWMNFKNMIGPINRVKAQPAF